ncbi:hypothetical protein [Bacillus sp. Marseille-Q3570]|uniref:hypothetical protein n=1 Tax=Bacillus sp. Marseille-Q3570 TaxID=2963522 RepID=UPI0021B77B80|nr:hypothetical protein [Bacillus sp. Marseille-Q3570]
MVPGTVANPFSHNDFEMVPGTDVNPFSANASEMVPGTDVNPFFAKASEGVPGTDVLWHRYSSKYNKKYQQGECRYSYLLL